MRERQAFEASKKRGQDKMDPQIEVSLTNRIGIAYPRHYALF